MTLLKACAALLVVLAAFSSHPVSAQTRKPRTSKTQAKVVYSCPMHPEVKSSKNGRCPKCGMDLRRVNVETPKPAAPAPTPNPTTETNSFSSSKIPNARVLDQN